jgi:hypothetical protein
MTKPWGRRGRSAVSRGAPHAPLVSRIYLSPAQNSRPLVDPKKGLSLAATAVSRPSHTQRRADAHLFDRHHERRLLEAERRDLQPLLPIELRGERLRHRTSPSAASKSNSGAVPRMPELRSAGPQSSASCPCAGTISAAITRAVESWPSSHWLMAAGRSQRIASLSSASSCRYGNAVRRGAPHNRARQRPGAPPRFGDRKRVYVPNVIRGIRTGARRREWTVAAPQIRPGSRRQSSTGSRAVRPFVTLHRCTRESLRRDANPTPACYFPS